MSFQYRIIINQKHYTPATQQSASVSRNPLGQYSGLASLAGIDITNQTANTAEAIKLATSLHFFENSIFTKYVFTKFNGS